MPSNISSRINLHSLYSLNKQGWFPWICQQCQIHQGMSILELGCGDGAYGPRTFPTAGNIHITLSDISSGMLRDARRAIGGEDPRFSFRLLTVHRIPLQGLDSFDLVIANHVLFYCDDIGTVCRNVTNILKPGGRFLCSTYGKDTYAGGQPAGPGSLMKGSSLRGQTV